MTAYNQKTIEKLAASRLKKVMSGLLRAGDRSKHFQLLNQMHDSINKGSGKPLSRYAGFTDTYRRMQAPPTVPEKSLRLKDRLTGSVVRKLTDSKKLYDARKGVRVEVQSNPGRGAFFRSYIGRQTRAGKPKYTKTYLNLRKQMRSPEKNPAGRIFSPSELSGPPGDVRSAFAHERAEAIDSIPAYKDRFSLSRPKPLNKQTSLTRRFLGRVGEFMRGREAPTRLSLYPKGQGRDNKLTGKILSHYSTNPLLAERLHAGGRTLVDRDDGFGLLVNPSYTIGSKEAERILRNVGNVGGYTPPPYGRAAGKASLQLEKRLGKGLSRLAQDQRKRQRHTLDGFTMSDEGAMLGDRRYTPDYRG